MRVYPVLQWWSFSLNDELLNLGAHQVLLLKRKVETDEFVKKHPKRENVNLQIVRCTVSHTWLLNSHLLSPLLLLSSPPLTPPPPFSLPLHCSWVCLYVPTFSVQASVPTYFKISGAMNPGDPLNPMTPPGVRRRLMPRSAIFTYTRPSLPPAAPSPVGARCWVVCGCKWDTADTVIYSYMSYTYPPSPQAPP